MNARKTAERRRQVAAEQELVKQHSEGAASRPFALCWVVNGEFRTASFGGEEFNLRPDGDGDFTLSQAVAPDADRFITLCRVGNWTTAIEEAEAFIAAGIVQRAEIIRDGEVE